MNTGRVGQLIRSFFIRNWCFKNHGLRTVGLRQTQMMLPDYSVLIALACQILSYWPQSGWIFHQHIGGYEAPRFHIGSDPMLLFNLSYK